RDRGVLDSATTQFFINLADNPQFDGQPGSQDPYTAGYTVFGRVVQGMEVLDRIAAVPTGAQGPFDAWVPRTPVVIERVQLIEGGPAASPAAEAQAAGKERRPRARCSSPTCTWIPADPRPPPPSSACWPARRAGPRPCTSSATCSRPGSATTIRANPAPASAPPSPTWPTAACRCS